jgi:hypothetical protein
VCFLLCLYSPNFSAINPPFLFTCLFRPFILSLNLLCYLSSPFYASACFFSFITFACSFLSFIIPLLLPSFCRKPFYYEYYFCLEKAEYAGSDLNAERINQVNRMKPSRTINRELID